MWPYFAWFRREIFKETKDSFSKSSPIPSTHSLWRLAMGVSSLEPGAHSLHGHKERLASMTSRLGREITSVLHISLPHMSYSNALMQPYPGMPCSAMELVPLKNGSRTSSVPKCYETTRDQTATAVQEQLARLSWRGGGGHSIMPPSRPPCRSGYFPRVSVHQDGTPCWGFIRATAAKMVSKQKLHVIIISSLRNALYGDYYITLGILIL